MKKLKILVFFLLGILSFSACEKDDICVDGDTQLLVIRFYDAEDTTALKVVPNLRVVGVGIGSPVDTFSDRSSSLDSIGIPLRTDNPLTEFNFIINSEDDENSVEIGNSDLVGFSYQINEVFISRACGFVAEYENLSTDFTAAPENWIQSIRIVNTSVKQEENLIAHVKIFH